MSTEDGSPLRTSNVELRNSSTDNEKKNDCTTPGQSLIKFMNLATGSVKTALQKPANYKKNINHRRYLQKQLKICTRRKKRAPKTKTASNLKNFSNGVPGFSTATTEIWKCGQMYGNQNFDNQIPPFQEKVFLPYETSFQSNGVLSMVECSFHDLSSAVNKESGFFTPYSFIPSQDTTASSHMNNTGLAHRDDLLPDIFEEPENFMTGEELTRTLDIKDLFVPSQTVQFEESVEEIVTFPHSSIDGTVCNEFQTIPSTSNILSW